MRNIKEWKGKDVYIYEFILKSVYRRNGFTHGTDADEILLCGNKGRGYSF